MRPGSPRTHAGRHRPPAERRTRRCHQTTSPLDANAQDSAGIDIERVFRCDARRRCQDAGRGHDGQQRIIADRRQVDDAGFARKEGPPRSTADARGPCSAGSARARHQRAGGLRLRFVHDAAAARQRGEADDTPRAFIVAALRSMRHRM